jgi:hypothetical protein
MHKHQQRQMHFLTPTHQNDHTFKSSPCSAAAAPLVELLPAGAPALPLLAAARLAAPHLTYGSKHLLLLQAGSTMHKHTRKKDEFKHTQSA